MSNPNLVDLRDWRKKPPFEPRKTCFASTRETLALLQAFISIESPLVRAVRLQMVWDNLSCLGTEALAQLG